MHTEDDTFRVLRKQPFHWIIQLVESIPDDTWNSYTDKEIDDLFIQYGWTYKEYVLAWSARP